MKIYSRNLQLFLLYQLKALVMQREKIVCEYSTASHESFLFDKKQTNKYYVTDHYSSITVILITK